MNKTRVLTLADILEALTGSRPASASLVISEAAVDSRQVIPGGLFVALPGERVDGHAYVADAFSRRASLALVQQDMGGQFPTLDLHAGNLPETSLPSAPFCIRVENSLAALQTVAGFWRRKFDLRVIGVTGSVGKSTTKELTAEVLSQGFHTLRNTGNLNNEIGLPLTLLRLTGGYECAVLEMGFYVPGEISFLCQLAQPSIGILTNIGTVHAERAGSQEIIARGKSELVQALPADGTAILNYDDPWIRPMAELTQARVLYYGLDPHADLWADEITGLGLKGLHLRLHYQGQSFSLNIPLIGRHSVHTVLRATAAGIATGLTWDQIIRGLQQGLSQLRLVATHTESGALLLDDTYNASPESTLAALNLLAELEGRHIAVLGDMLELGPYEQQGHEMVGARAAEIVGWLIAVGPRARMIASAAQKAGLSQKKILCLDDPLDVIDVLRDRLQSGDVVLIKGSHGMRMDRIVSALEVAA